MAATWFPSSPRWSAVRTDTGTIAFSSIPSVARACRSRCARSAPVTTVSTTSLTVPPSAPLIALKRPSSDSTQANRRCGPIRVLSGLGGAPPMPADAIDASPATVLAACSAAARGALTMPAAARAASNGVPARSITASANSDGPLGSGRGYQGGLGSRSGGSGSRSNSTVMMSTPEMPSTSAWCVLQTSPKWSSPTRLTSQISHSGFERSSCCENTRPARLRSCSSLAGSGSAV